MHRTPSTLALLAVAALAPNTLAQGPLFLSTVVDDTLGGVAIDDNGAYATTLTGSPTSLAVTLASGDLDALHRTGPDTWLVSSLFNGNFNGTVFDDGDLVEVNTATGTTTTILPNSIFTSSAPDITGVSILPNGNYLLSLLGSSNTITTNTGSLSFTDGDIIEYNPTTLEASVFLSEADLFDDGDGDVYGIHAFDDGTLLLTANTDEVISNVSVLDGDAFLYNPATDTAEVVFSEALFAGNADIDALYFEGPIPSPGAVALLGLAFVGARRRRA
ncbi:MAG: hypothetical protein AAGH64_10645 [Planctomycetota bacterium]